MLKMEKHDQKNVYKKNDKRQKPQKNENPVSKIETSQTKHGSLANKQYTTKSADPKLPRRSETAPKTETPQTKQGATVNKQHIPKYGYNQTTDTKKSASPKPFERNGGGMKKKEQPKLNNGASGITKKKLKLRRDRVALAKRRLQRIAKDQQARLRALLV